MNRRLKKLTLITVWLILCAVFGYYASTLPVVKDHLAIKEVVLKGSSRLSEEDVKYLFKSENWFFVSGNSLLKKASVKYPFIEDIKLNKPQFGVVEFEVKERKPYAFVRVLNTSQLFLIDEKGNLIKDTSFYKKEELSDLKLVTVDSEDLASDILRYIRTFENSVPELKLKEFIIRASILSGITEDSKIIILSTENIEDSLNKLRIFSRRKSLKEFSYLNFSFDSMVITKK